MPADPTPAAPDPQPRVCSNCGAVLGPKETGHFVPPSVGESGFYYCRGAAPGQAEGPREPCSQCGRPLTWCDSETLKAWVCENCPGPNSQPTPNNSQIRSWDPTDREIL